MALYLGLDAGGTKTACALAEDDRILARTRAGSIKPLRVAATVAAENMRLLLAEIARQSGADLRTVKASCIGTAGVRLPQTQAWMRQILSAHANGEIEVCGDETIALDGVYPGGAGVLVMAGTGSNLLARTSAGDTFNVGGWGPALGDEGSGYWIGHQALRAAFRALDLDRPALLLQAVMEQWSAPTLGDLVSMANATPPPDFSQLAPIVVACAEQGDEASRHILDLGGCLLGEGAAHACRKLVATDPEAPARIAYTGSILTGVPRVRESMFRAIERALPEAECVHEPADPILGALWRARQLAVSSQRR